jgi:16S rRNA (guanine527-N7)-methyltransferase
MTMRRVESNLDAQDRARLAQYAGLVRRHARRLGLVSDSDVSRLEERHIQDCFRAVAAVRSAPPGPAVDVGSGAGLPGIPLAIAVPDRHWRLLEPRRNRAAFLEEAVRQLRLNCEVLAVTAERAAADPALARAHALATARALAPPERAFELLKPLVAGGGIALVFVGRAARLPPEAVVSEEGVATIRVRHERSR